MPRDIPSDHQQDIMDPFSGSAWFHLVEVTVPGFTTLRLARNTVNVTYDGDMYTKFNFDVSEQTLSSDGSIPRTSVVFAQEDDRTVEDLINESEGCENGTVRIIKVCSDFLSDSVPALETNYEILAADSTEEQATLTLGSPNYLNRKVPLRIYAVEPCPWAEDDLFKGVECGYSGVDDSCTGTYADCISKSNQINFGGDLGLDPNGLTI